jgi:hypothetical protein
LASYGLVQHRWVRTRPSGQPAEDICVNTLHCQVTDGGWTTDDRDVYLASWTTCFNAIKTLISDYYNQQEIRFYNLPATPGPSGDPAFTSVVNRVGTSGHAGELPPQCAMSVTLEAVIRRRWGRIYLPGLTTSALDTGRWGSVATDAVCDAFDAHFSGLRGSGQGIVTWHRATWTPTDVQHIRVDDVPDVIRRRRFGQKYHWKEASLLT